jgi:WD40 repeat protein
MAHEVVVYDESKDAAHILDLGFVISLSFSRDGTLVAAATSGGVKVWDAESGQEKQ